MEQLWTSLLHVHQPARQPRLGRAHCAHPARRACGLVGLSSSGCSCVDASVGPTRRGKHRLPPQPPAGVHAGETLLVAAVRGDRRRAPALLRDRLPRPDPGRGRRILVLALLYWLRESMRDYDHVEHPTTALVPVVVDRPATRGPRSGAVVPPDHRVAVAGRPLLRPRLRAVADRRRSAHAGDRAAPVARRRPSRVPGRGLVADVTGHLPADPRAGLSARRRSARSRRCSSGRSCCRRASCRPRAHGDGGDGDAVGPPRRRAAPGACGAPAASGAGQARPSRRQRRGRTNIAFVGGTTARQGPGRQGLHDRVRQPRRGHPAQHRHPRRRGRPAASSGRARSSRASTRPSTTSRRRSRPAAYTFICDVHPTMTGTLVVK